MKPFLIFLRKKSDKREKVKLSFAENRKSIALSILEIFEFELCVNRCVYVCSQGPFVKKRAPVNIFC